MPDARYYATLLQVPAAEVPDDYTDARRPLTIERHGGMVLLRLGAVEGREGEPYSALIPGSQVAAIIHTLEVLQANIGR